MEQGAVEGGVQSFAILYAGVGVGSCMYMVLVVYNIVALVGYMRQDSDGESASGMAKATWGIGFASMFLGPCGWFFGLVAIILSRIVKGQVYREETTLISATPASMGATNGGIVLVVNCIAVTAALINLAM